MTEVIYTPRVVDPSFPIPEGLVGYQYAKRTDALSLEELSKTLVGNVGHPVTGNGGIITDPTGIGTIIYIPTTDNFTIDSQIVSITPTGDQVIKAVAIVDDLAGLLVDGWDIRITKA